MLLAPLSGLLLALASLMPAQQLVVTYNPMSCVDPGRVEDIHREFWNAAVMSLVGTRQRADRNKLYKRQGHFHYF
eukprot:13076225-Alexandrium_andersonii.AAC.1